MLGALGVWMLLEHEDVSADRVARLSGGNGLGLLALGLSVSLDELAMGFTIGLLGLPVWLAIALIGAQAFLFAQLGLRLGQRLGEALRERAEQAAGLALLGLALPAPRREAGLARGSAVPCSATDAGGRGR